MRFQGKSRLGFYPLPSSEAQRIRRFLWFPDAPSSAIDPCVGDGVAFEVITSGAEVFRYGIELDAYRAEQARQRIPNIVQGNTLEVQCPVECFGLLYLNPPYDWTLGPADSRRTEQSFLSHTYRWLKPGGVLIFVIPGDRLAECSQILSTHFRDVRVYWLESPECVRYKQVVVIGARRSRREKERLTDSDITRARLYYASLARNPSQIPALPSEPEVRFNVPVSGPVQLVYRGLPLDEIEDMLPQSAAYRQAGRILFADPVSATGRPLTPLHAGHVGLLACSGLLNGIFGDHQIPTYCFLAGSKSNRQNRGRRGWSHHGQREGTILERIDAGLFHRRSRHTEIIPPPPKSSSHSHQSPEETMKNAHERFGALEYTKRMKDTTTRIRVRLDRFIGEVEDGRNGKAHLISVMGGDSDVGAIWAAVIEHNLFTVEAPGIEPVTASLGEDAQCFRGTITVAGRKPTLQMEAWLPVTGGLNKCRGVATKKVTFVFVTT